jgi:hypothetical protein
VDENCLTFYHPFILPVIPGNLSKLPVKKRTLLIRRYQAQSVIDRKKDKYGYLVLRTMDAITRTR